MYASELEESVVVQRKLEKKAEKLRVGEKKKKKKVALGYVRAEAY